jgi:hypothetical protein
VNATNPLGVGGKLAREYAALQRQLWSSAGPVLPRALKWTVSEHAPQFRGSMQHDCQELLAYLLDALHEDVNRVRAKPYLPADSGLYRRALPTRAALHTRAREAWTRHLARNNSALVELFQGLFESTVTCPDCETVSITFDPFMYLSLPLPRRATALTVRVVTGAQLTRVTWKSLAVQSMRIADLKRLVIDTLTLDVTSTELAVTRVNPRTMMITRVLRDDEGVNRLLAMEDDIYVYHVTPVTLTRVTPQPATDMSGMPIGLTPLTDARTSELGNYVLSEHVESVTPVTHVTVPIVYRVLKPCQYQTASLFAASAAPAEWQWQHRPVVVPLLVVLPRAKYSYIELVKICELKLRTLVDVKGSTPLNLSVTLVDASTQRSADLSRAWHSSRAVPLASDMYLAADLDLRVINSKLIVAKVRWSRDCC